jgi:hypothetical protein
MPHAKVLRPSLCELPIASPCLPPRLQATGKPHCHRGVASPCCTGRSRSSPLHYRDVSTKHLTTTPRAVPLLPPPLLAPRAAPSSLQLPTPEPHRHHALARPCAPRGHHQSPLSSSPPHHRRTDKNAFGVASSPAPADCCLVVLCAHACMLALSEHGHALHAMPEPSCPSHSIHVPIRGGHPIPCRPHPRPLVRLW